MIAMHLTLGPGGWGEPCAFQRAQRRLLDMLKDGQRAFPCGAVDARARDR